MFEASLPCFVWKDLTYQVALGVVVISRNLRCEWAIVIRSEAAATSEVVQVRTCDFHDLATVTHDGAGFRVFFNQTLKHLLLLEWIGYL